eukprot:jgi/Tetstr1/435512/TSEL_024416.t1
MCYEMLCARDDVDQDGNNRPSFCASLIPRPPPPPSAFAALARVPGMVLLMLGAVVAAHAYTGAAGALRGDHPGDPALCALMLGLREVGGAALWDAALRGGRPRSRELAGRLCAAAARDGHLQLLVWAREAGCPLDETTCSAAAAGGHLAVLRWARANGCPWTSQTCAYAPEGGHMAVLAWAREAGCPWDESTCSFAARAGQLGVLRWARARGCPWNCLTCAYAALGGHLAVLVWAHANGFPCHAGTCAAAARGGHLDVLTNSRTQNTVVFADSSTRDKRAWPNSAEFTIQFEQPVQNVVSMAVLDATVPATVYAVDRHNNLLQRTL